MKETARIAYDAYCAALLEHAGQRMEAWIDLPETGRVAWRAAMDAVLGAG